MAQRTPPAQIIEYVAQLKGIYSDIRKVYLFGSYARGTSTEDSDIDLAFVFDDVDDIFERQVQLMKFRRKFEPRIEPHVFKNSDFVVSYPMVEEIVKTGFEIR